MRKPVRAERAFVYSSVFRRCRLRVRIQFGHAFRGGTGYNASKFGLLGPNEAMMLDVRHEGVCVSLVMPESVDTHFRSREPAPERTWRLHSDDCAVAILQLLSYPKEAHMSRIEIRPSMPPRKR